MASSTQQKWQGRWEQLVGKAKSVWGNLTDDRIQEAQGDYERLVGVIHEETGKSREEIEKELNK
jgi:uncharacterized protein YjbJ (UPF0337 family)